MCGHSIGSTCRSNVWGGLGGRRVKLGRDSRRRSQFWATQIDGKEATRRLRAQERFQSLPIIALTAHAIKGEDEEILASGVTDLITKPLDEEVLLERLRKLLN